MRYVQQDWQGSVRTVTSNTGFVVSRTDHQAFGEEIGAGDGGGYPSWMNAMWDHVNWVNSIRVGGTRTSVVIRDY